MLKVRDDHPPGVRVPSWESGEGIRQHLCLGICTESLWEGNCCMGTSPITNIIVPHACSYSKTSTYFKHTSINVDGNYVGLYAT